MRAHRGNVINVVYGGLLFLRLDDRGRSEQENAQRATLRYCSWIRPEFGKSWGGPQNWMTSRQSSPRCWNRNVGRHKAPQEIGIGKSGTSPKKPDQRRGGLSLFCPDVASRGGLLQDRGCVLGQPHPAENKNHQETDGNPHTVRHQIINGARPLGDESLACFERGGI